ncbi:MAG: hypothetical protein BalsKO_05600 [Balneolaceae bacterium]
MKLKMTIKLVAILGTFLASSQRAEGYNRYAKKILKANGTRSCFVMLRTVITAKINSMRIRYFAAMG